jgi:phospholipase C
MKSALWRRQELFGIVAIIKNIIRIWQQCAKQEETTMAEEAAVTARGTKTVEEDTTFTLRVMTYNVQQLYNVLGPKTWWDQGQRAQHLPAALQHFCSDASQRPDVLILNEAFNSHATWAATQLHDLFPYQTPVLGTSTKGWAATTGPFQSWGVAINGGVIILSRYEIVEQRQHIYSATHPSTWDRFAHKGIVYAKICVPHYDPTRNHPPEDTSTFVHIFGTHLQADEGHVPCEEAHLVRMEQLREIRNYIVQELQLQPSSERVIIGGDFNIEYTTEQFRKDLKRNLHVQIHYHHGMPGSFSAPHNWMTKANARANQQSEERNETLDYIVVPTDYIQPINQPQMHVVPLKACESWYWWYFAYQWPQESQKGMTCDLSDHYPVMVTFQFPR